MRNPDELPDRTPADAGLTFDDALELAKSDFLSWYHEQQRDPDWEASWEELQRQADKFKAARFGLLSFAELRKGLFASISPNDDYERARRQQTTPAATKFRYRTMTAWQLVNALFFEVPDDEMNAVGLEMDRRAREAGCATIHEWVLAERSKALKED